MKYRFLPLLLLSLLFIRCQQPPIILSTQTSLTQPDGSGFSAYTNYIYFSSLAVGSQTEITFSSEDGDFAKFTLSSVAPANLNLASIARVEINFVAVTGGAITVTEGFLNITSSQGTGSNVTAFGGSFQFNLKTTSDDPVGPPGDPGTIKGVFNYVKQ